MAAGRVRLGPVNGRGGGDSPTPEAVEALVRAIAAKEANEAGGEAGIADEAVAAVKPERSSPARPMSSAADARRKPQAPYRAPGGPPGLGGPIPGLVERQAWEASLVEEAERQRRYDRPLAILIAELEGLEPEATAMGTRIIARMAPHCAAILLELARASDRVTRLSSSRFGVLLLEADEAGAETYAERARAACAAWLEPSPVAMRLSVGWAIARGPGELLDALRTADTRLRAAA